MSALLEIIAGFFVDLWLRLRGRDGNEAFLGESGPRERSGFWRWFFVLVVIASVVWLIFH